MGGEEQGVLGKMLFFENIKTRKTRRASERVAPKRAEKFHPAAERIGDFRRGDNRRQRKRIANRFAKHNDIGNHALRFESPEMRSKTPESDLYFVGDTNRACSAHVTVNLREIIRRKNDLAADARQRFCDIGCHSTSVSARPLQDLRTLPPIFHTPSFSSPAIRAAVV